MDERTPADAFRQVVADLDDVIAEVDRTDGWDRPTPCDGWLARDVVAHLADWTPWLLEVTGRAVPDPAMPAVDRWRRIAADLAEVLDDPDASAVEIETGPPGRMPVGRAISMFVTGDVAFHVWDLARSNDLEPRLDEAILAEQLAGMQSMEQAIRDSGHFGARFEVGPEATIVERALAFTGRDPAWQPDR